MVTKYQKAGIALVIISLMIGAAIYQSTNLDSDIILDAEIEPSSIFTTTAETISFDASNSIGAITNYIWVFPFNNITSTSTPQISHKFDKPGRYQISLIIFDQNGLSDLDTTEIVVDHTAPEFEIQTTSLTYLEDENIELSVNQISAVSDDEMTFHWDFGDTTTSNKNSPDPVTHSYENQGNYLVTLTATDQHGAVSYDYIEIEIENQAPQAIAEINATDVVEDEVILFNASQTIETTSDYSSLQYFWDFGDGQYSSESIISHSYSEQGTYTAKLTVKDDNGETSYVEFVIDVNNAYPSINIQTGQRFIEGQTYIFRASGSDTVSDRGNLAYQWRFNDTGFNATYTNFDSGVTEVNSTISDNNGAFGYYSETVNIENAPPIASIYDASIISNITVRVVGTLAPELNLTLFRNGNSYLTFNISQIHNLMWEQTVMNINLNPGDTWNFQIDYGSDTTDPTQFAVVMLFIRNDPGLLVKNHVVKDKFPSTYHKNYTINQGLFGFPISLTSDIFDPGRDDIKLTWKSSTNPDSSVSKIYSKPDYGPTSIIDTTELIVLPQEFSDVVSILNNYLETGWINETLLEIQDLNDTEVEEQVWELYEYTVERVEQILNNYNTTDTLFLTSFDDANNVSIHLEVDDLDGDTFNYSFDVVNETGLFIPYLSPKLNIHDIHNNEQLNQLSIFEDEGISLTSQFTKYWQNEILSSNISVIWDFGDGTKINASLNETISYTYVNNGIYIIRVIGSDGIIQFHDFIIVEVENSRPTARISYPQHADEDELVTFDASDSYDSISDISSLQFYWEFGDGTTGSGIQINHQYSKQGNYTVILYVTDDNGYRVNITKQIQIKNRTPNIVINNSFDITEGQVLSLKADIQDSVSDLESLEYKWIMNDEIISTSRSVDRYFDNGQYMLHLTVTDDNNATNEFVVDISVQNILPTISVIEHGFHGQLDWDVELTAFVIDSPLDIDDLTFEWDLIDDGSTIRLDDGAISSTKISTDFSVSTTSNRFYSNRLSVSDGTDSVSNQTNFDTVTDTDGDIWTDFEEEVITGTLTDNYDTDGDQIIDSLEEFLYDTDPLLEDSDGDGLWDGYNPEVGFGELTLGTSPDNNDTDDDTLLDGTEIFGWQITLQINGVQNTTIVTSDPLLEDTDGDGLLDGEEFQLGSNPNAIDTDNDGLTDLEEVEIGTNLVSDDTDGDGVKDGVEISPYTVIWQTSSLSGGWDDHVENDVVSDPLLADTDGDGLSDFEERYDGEDGARTHANRTDTDNDGVDDASEQYVLRFPINDRYIYDNDNNRLISKTTKVFGSIKKVELVVSTSGLTKDDIKIDVVRWNGGFSFQTRSFTPDFGDSPVSFLSHDISDDFSSFSGSQSWFINLDYIGASDSYEIVVEELAFVFTIETNKLNNDNDRDFLTDGEEINIGADGWKTDPYNSDTDGDGLSDFYETVPIGDRVRTNPTLADTDGDGFPDGIDESPLANTLVSVEIISIELFQDVDGEVGHGDIFTIVYFDPDSADSYFYATEDKHFDSNKKLSYNDKYYYEIDDDLTNLDLVIEVWDKDSATADDFGASRSINYHLSWGSLKQTITYVDGDGDNVFDITYEIKTVQVDRRPTFLINASSVIEDDYGDLKYTGDEQFYVIYAEVFDRFPIPVAPGFVDVSDGIYTVIVSRGTLINTGLNQTFLQGSLDDVPNYLKDFEFSTDDYANGNSKKLIAGVLSGELLRQELDLLLTLLTTNSTGYSFGESIEVTSRLLELGLPQELINLVPLEGFSNSPTGEMPESFKDKVEEAVDAVINVAVDVLEFLAAGLVAIGDFLAKIVDIVASVGKKVLGAIKDAYNEVKNIVENLANMIERAFEFIIETTTELISSGLNAISSIFTGWVQQFQSVFAPFVEGMTASDANSLHLDSIMLNSGIPDELILGILLLSIGSSLWFIAGALATLAVAAELVSIQQTGGMVGLMKFALNKPFSKLAVAIIISIVAVLVIETFDLGSHDGTGSGIIDQFNEFAGDIFQFVFIIGFGLLEVLSVSLVAIGSRTGFTGFIVDPVWSELRISFMVILLLSIRYFFFLPQLHEAEEHHDVELEIYLLGFMIILDLILFNIAINGLIHFIRFEAQGWGLVGHAHILLFDLARVLPILLFSIAGLHLIEDVTHLLLIINNES